jgi:hypothetical protein
MKRVQTGAAAFITTLSAALPICGVGGTLPCPDLVGRIPHGPTSKVAINGSYAYYDSGPVSVSVPYRCRCQALSVPGFRTLESCIFNRHG